MKTIKTNFGNSGISVYIKAIVSGLVFGIVIAGTLLCVFAALILVIGKIPYTAIPYVIIAILSVGTFLSAYIAARILKFKGLMLGLISGGLFFILTLIGGFAFTSDAPGVLTLLRLVAFAVSGALGGIIGVNVKDKIKIR